MATCRFTSGFDSLGQLQRVQFAQQHDWINGVTVHDAWNQ